MQSGKNTRHLPAFVLLFLAREGELYGGALVSRLGGILPRTWCLDPGAVYRVLRDLEERKAVISYWSIEEAGRPRRYYRITDGGLEQLAGWREDILARYNILGFFLKEYDMLPHCSTGQGGDR